MKLNEQKKYPTIGIVLFSAVTSAVTTLLLVVWVLPKYLQVEPFRWGEQLGLNNKQTISIGPQRKMTAYPAERMVFQSQTSSTSG